MTHIKLYSKVKTLHSKIAVQLSLGFKLTIKSLAKRFISTVVVLVK